MARRGRPPVPLDQRMVSVSVRLEPKTADLVYRMAKARDVSQYQFCGDLITRLLELHRIRHPHLSCYGEGQQPSTLSYTLSEPPA